LDHATAPDHAKAIEQLFEEQLEAADLVVVSRADCLDGAALERVRLRLRQSLRPGTPVFPVERGRLDPAVALGIDRPRFSTAKGKDHQGAGQDPGPGQHQVLHQEPHHDHHLEQDHHGEHDQHEDHDHHDHAHVAMESMVVELDGKFGRSELEQTLLAMIRSRGLVRVKGRLWQAGKALPLQIQAAGPRLECWYEGQLAKQPAQPCLQLVVMGFGLDQRAIRDQLAALAG
jgi:cobalamin biosynthesis protein CobW